MAEFTWLPDLHRYRNDDTGEWASDAEVRGWSDAHIGVSADHSRGLAGALAGGDLTLGAWEESMRAQIKGEYVRQYLLGRGGRDQMTQADWGSIGGMLARQYHPFLDDFAADIAAGKLSEAQIAARSEQYLRSSKQAFEKANERARTSDTLVKWTMMAAEHCFPAGTKILTPSGQVAIEKVGVGDLVNTLQGPRVVTKTYSREFSGSLTRIEKEGTVVYCTPNHPFLTKDGWRRAASLRTGDPMLFKDVSQEVAREVGLPNTDDLEASRLKILVLRPVPPLLRYLAFSERFKSLMPVPPVAIYLNDYISNLGVNNKFRLDNGKGLKVNSKLFKKSKQFLFQLCRFAHLNFALAFNKGQKMFRVFSQPAPRSFSKPLTCARGLRRIVFPHILSSLTMNKPICCSLVQSQSELIGLVLNLRACFVNMLRCFVRSHVGIVFTKKDHFCVSPMAFLKDRVVLGTKSGFPNSIVVSANGTLLAQGLSSHSTIMSITATGRTEPMTFFQDRPTTKLTFLHPDNPPLQLYPSSEKSQVVYNLGVESVHHYVANGFVVHNCDTCVDYASMGWQPIVDDPFGGAVPRDGSTICKMGCQCHREYRRR